MAHHARRVLVVDDYPLMRKHLTTLLTQHGHEVEAVEDAHSGAERVFRWRPDVVVTDLWMPNISGLQLCRLLRAEPTTAHVPVILVTASGDKKTRFWADHAGAAALLTKDRVAELPRLIDETCSVSMPPPNADTPAASYDIQARLARLLDEALYDSVIAAEVRALANAGSIGRLFNGLALLLSQVTTYRWLAVADELGTLGLHANPESFAVAEKEARLALGVSPDVRLLSLEDPRAPAGGSRTPPLTGTISFGGVKVGRIAIALQGQNVATVDSRLFALVTSELGGPMRMAALVEESRRLAATDPLTGLMNRRAFSEALEREAASASRHGHSLSLVVLDVDHFKRINDTRGHAAGDRVLYGLAQLLAAHVRKGDLVGRWGGEEFVALLPHTPLPGACALSERLLTRIANERFMAPDGTHVSATASIGVAAHHPKESVDDLLTRADAAMYAAKGAGRNRVRAA